MPHHLTTILEQSRVSLGLTVSQWHMGAGIFRRDYVRMLKEDMPPSAGILRKATVFYRSWLIDESQKTVTWDAEWRNLTGEKHGVFIVLAQVKGSRLWLCRCDLCRSVLPLSESVLRRSPMSCGCHIPRAQARLVRPDKPHKLPKEVKKFHTNMHIRAWQAGAKLCKRWRGSGASQRCWDDCQPHRGYPWKRIFYTKVWGPRTMRWVDCREYKNVRRSWGRLTVIKRWNPGPDYPVYLCRCSCGRRLILDRMRLRNSRRWQKGCSEECRSKIIYRKTGMTMWEWSLRNGIPYGFVMDHRHHEGHGNWKWVRVKELWEFHKHRYLIGVSAR